MHNTNADHIYLMNVYKYTQRHITIFKEKDIFPDEMLNSLVALQAESFLG